MFVCPLFEDPSVVTLVVSNSILLRILFDINVPLICDKVNIYKYVQYSLIETHKIIPVLLQVCFPPSETEDFGSQTQK